MPPKAPSAKLPVILTVDDAKTVRTLAQKILSPFKCDTREAANGFNALFSMEQVLPDLILLDIVMPIMGGLEFLTMVRSKPELRAIPVIVLASPSDHAVMGKMNALGVSGTVVKPFKEETLLAEIRRVLPLKSIDSAATR